MGWLFKLLPSWVPLALGGVILAGVVGGYFAWQHHERMIGAAAIEASNQKAIIAQQAKDAQLSREQILKLQGRIEQIDATAAPIRERIIHVPVTTSCGPAIAAAADGVRALLNEANRPAAGPVAPVALHPSQKPAR